MSFLGNLGANTIARARGLNYLVAACWTLLCLAARPRHWPRTTRAVFARQVLFTGFEALKFVMLVALMTGISVVVQAQLWLGKAGQSALLGP
ncbi:MAG: hypothetical protein LC725_08760, partial [Lentisphaerae bacterium]|nr:hypothetical protein [Lentisphaerota bacterium]